jgi:glycosyltransferase involved in cell wall biosynthesis
VIVDTGSNDGTEKILKEKTIRFSGLRVFEYPFNGFANSRNFSLRKFEETGLKFALILDADERLTEEDFEKLEEVLKSPDMAALNFNFINIYPDMAMKAMNYHNPRLFSLSPDIKYHDTNGVHEYLNACPKSLESGIIIKHFMSVGETEKKERIYWPMRNSYGSTKTFPDFSNDSFYIQSKRFNKQRLNLNKDSFKDLLARAC